MKSIARIAAGLLVAAVPIVMSGAPVAHADTRLNETCVGQVNIQFGHNEVFGEVLGPVFFGQYDRGYFVNCDDVVLTDPPLGVQLQTAAHSGRVYQNTSLIGGCVAALMSGGGDFRNGEGVLIGGSVIVAGSAVPLSNDVAFAEVDVMLPNATPCIGETVGQDLLAVNDTVL